MTGPDGSSTKRDQRREARREQYRQTQAQRKRQRRQELRRQAIRRYAVIGALALGVFLLVAFIAVNLITGQHAGATQLRPANGQVVDGLPCAPEVITVHRHTELQIWVNGEQVPVPAGTGIVAPPPYHAQASNGATICLYGLHVHDGNPSLIHIELATDRPVTAGNLFHIWGQQIGGDQFMGNKIDSKHPLVVEIYDAQNKLTQTYTGKLEDLAFKDHQTILVKYNSPGAKLQPYNWGS